MLTDFGLHPLTGHILLPAGCEEGRRGEEKGKAGIAAFELCYLLLISARLGKICISRRRFFRKGFGRFSVLRKGLARGLLILRAFCFGRAACKLLGRRCTNNSLRCLWSVVWSLGLVYTMEMI